MTVLYRRRRNGTTSSTSAPVTQQFTRPVTRSHARRVAIDATWAAIGQPYPVAYQWVRVTPQGTSRFVRWAA